MMTRGENEALEAMKWRSAAIRECVGGWPEDVARSEIERWAPREGTMLVAFSHPGEEGHAIGPYHTPTALAEHILSSRKAFPVARVLSIYHKGEWVDTDNETEAK